MKCLIVNIGSSSKKYALYAGEKEIFSHHFEHSRDKVELTESHESTQTTSSLAAAEYANALAITLEALLTRKIVAGLDEIERVGLRIVAPGTSFQQHAKIDDTYVQALQDLASEEPLHIRPILVEINSIKTAFAQTPLFGLSDSAFHASMPNYARRYALDKDSAEKEDIMRFGYHGFSFASVVQKLKTRGPLAEKVVICHLGSGASVAAIKKGISIDTSMGFSPLEGLVMASRIGDIDAGALLRLARRRKYSYDELEEYLYTECGLKGLSGKSADIRELIAIEKDDPDAQLALELFVYRIQKYIGAYAAAMGGIDALVFTGTIGQRSWILRSRICSGLEFLGISIDETKNNTEIPDGELLIGSSTASVLAMKTDEMREMARVTENL